MICERIEELSILYIENELDDEAAADFLNHVGECKNCRLLFDTIRINYDKDVEVNDKPDIASLVMKLVNPHRYLSENTRKKVQFKRVLVLAVIFSLILISAVNAGGIFKSFKELKERMFVDKKLLNISGIIHTGTYSDEDYVNEVYMKYIDDVEDFADKMSLGENRSLFYDEQGKDFKVQIAKSSGGNFISYGFDGYTIFSNDYLERFHRSQAMAVISGFVKYTTTEELLDSANLAPRPKYIPTGYDLDYAYKSGRPDSLGLHYTDGAGGLLSIELSKNKLALNDVGIPEDLKIAAGLEDSDIPNSDDDSFNEEILVGDLQGVFVQEKVNNAAKKDEYRIFKTINLYMGDGTVFPFLRISSQSLDKPELVRIAENIEVLSLDENLADEKEYFQGIEDGNILYHTKEFLDKIKAGKTDFKIMVDENTEFYRYSHNDTYYIMYRKIDIDSFKSVIPFDIVLDQKIIKQFEYVDVQILGKPYDLVKSYYLSFVNDKHTGLGITFDKFKSIPGDYELNDIIIYRMSGMRNDIDPFFDDSGHLFYIVETQGKSWVVQTVIKDGAGYRNINIIADKEILKTLDELKQFLISLEFDS